MNNCIDNNVKMRKNLWRYCKDTFEPADVNDPQFSEQECCDYFSNNLSEKNKSFMQKFPLVDEKNERSNSTLRYDRSIIF